MDILHSYFHVMFFFILFGCFCWNILNILFGWIWTVIFCIVLSCRPVIAWTRLHLFNIFCPRVLLCGQIPFMRHLLFELDTSNLSLKGLGLQLKFAWSVFSFHTYSTVYSPTDSWLKLYSKQSFPVARGIFFFQKHRNLCMAFTPSCLFSIWCEVQGVKHGLDCALTVSKLRI